MGSTDAKALGSDEVIKMGYSDGKVFGTILVNVYVITLGLDIGTDLVSLYEAFDGSNYSKIQGLLFGDSLGYTNGKVIDYD